MKLIVGLGNPGLKYKNTRHNVGFEAIDHLADVYSFPEFKPSDKFNALISEGDVEGEKLILVKPLTFMNLSGQSVSKVVSYYKLPIKDVIVIYDDVNIPTGTIRVRPNGSAGGHNGIHSLIEELGTDKFPRIRIGTEPKSPFPGALEDYVLGRFTNGQVELIKENIDKIPEVIAVILEKGYEEAMNQYN